MVLFLFLFSCLHAAHDTKEQLATIRQYGQREYAAAARAKAAARKAEEAAKAATIDVSMEEGTGFGVLNFEEEV